MLSISHQEKGPGTKNPRADSLAAPASAGPAAWTRTTVTARPAGSALRLGPRLVHDEVPISEEASVQHLYRLRRLRLGGHLDEPESARPSREMNDADAKRLDGAS